MLSWPEQKPILIIADDEAAVRAEVADTAINIGFDVPFDARAVNASDAISAIERHASSGRLAALITDLGMTGVDGNGVGGWDVVRYCSANARTLPLAMLTAYGGTNDIIGLLRSGAAIPAFTIFDKPADLDLDGKLYQWLYDIYYTWTSQLGIVLKDATAFHIYNELAPLYASSDLPILIVGETGTGKESLARYVHDLSMRSGPFISVNCGALEESLAFAELFGHQQGAYTDALSNDLGLALKASGYAGEPSLKDAKSGFIPWLKKANPDLEEPSRANGDLYGSAAARRNAGTLFLDEVAALPPKLMAGLLRLLSSRDVLPVGYHGKGLRAYCRIIAATNELSALNPVKRKDAVAAFFRHDLFYRIAGAILHLPSLRERSADDVRIFLSAPSSWADLGLNRMDVAEDAVLRTIALYQTDSDDLARQYQAGNFRTLRHLLHRAALLAERDGAAALSLTHLNLAIQHGQLQAYPNDVLADHYDKISYIRHKFLEFAHSVRPPLLINAEKLNSANLKAATDANPAAAAKAFIECMLMQRPAADPQTGSPYMQREVETAISGRGQNAYLTKSLRKEHFLEAAKLYFGTECADGTEISDIIKLVRSKMIS